MGGPKRGFWVAPECCGKEQYILMHQNKLPWPYKYSLNEFSHFQYYYKYIIEGIIYKMRVWGSDKWRYVVWDRVSQWHPRTWCPGVRSRRGYSCRHRWRHSRLQRHRRCGVPTTRPSFAAESLWSSLSCRSDLRPAEIKRIANDAFDNGML